MRFASNLRRFHLLHSAGISRVFETIRDRICDHLHVEEPLSLLSGFGSFWFLWDDFPSSLNPWETDGEVRYFLSLPWSSSTLDNVTRLLPFEDQFGSSIEVNWFEPQTGSLCLVTESRLLLNFAHESGEPGSDAVRDIQTLAGAWGLTCTMHDDGRLTLVGETTLGRVEPSYSWFGEEHGIPWLVSLVGISGVEQLKRAFELSTTALVESKASPNEIFCEMKPDNVPLDIIRDACRAVGERWTMRFSGEYAPSLDLAGALDLPEGYYPILCWTEGDSTAPLAERVFQLGVRNVAGVRTTEVLTTEPDEVVAPILLGLDPKPAPSP